MIITYISYYLVKLNHKRENW